MKGRFLAMILCLPALVVPAAGEKRVTLKGDTLSLVLPAGWKTTDRKTTYEETLGAFQSEDNTSSVFLSTVNTRPEFDLPLVMDGIVHNFEEAFIFQRMGDYKSGEIAGVNAVFASLDLELKSANSQATLPFRFYLTVFELDSVVYLVQGSIQKPVKKEREQEILTIIRSIDKAG